MHGLYQVLIFSLSQCSQSACLFWHSIGLCREVCREYRPTRRDLACVVDAHVFDLDSLSVSNYNASASVTSQHIFNIERENNENSAHVQVIWIVRMVRLRIRMLLCLTCLKF
jgi:hypothetical protein